MATQNEKQPISDRDIIVALVRQGGAYKKAQSDYYNATLQIDKRDTLAELNRQQRLMLDAFSHVSHLLNLGPAPIEPSQVEALMEEMRAAQRDRLESFAKQALTVLDAQQAYFKLAHTGYNKDKEAAKRNAIQLEHGLREKSNLVLSKPLPIQTNLF